MHAYPAKRTWLGPLEIRRALPLRERRMVGPWCFLDSYGPMTFAEGKPMDVAPHPHIGLQTVSWLLDGEVLHRDSLGYENLIRPGELNLMTSARGISHSEETPRSHSGRLMGVQLWVALPDAVRNVAPHFAHHADIPVVDYRGATAKVFAGGPSPAQFHSPIAGAEVQLRDRCVLPVDPSFEHALLLLSGTATLDGEELARNVLYYLEPGRSEFPMAGTGTLLLLGGTPFPEKILMWWNFVARSHEEIVAAREEWIHGTAFGEVKGYDGPRIPPPGLTGRPVPANPAS